MNRTFIVLIFVGMVFLSACGGAAAPTASQQNVSPKGVGTPVVVEGGSYNQISPKALNDWLVKKDFTLINVHVPFAGNLPQTDLSIPYDQIDQNLAKLPSDKGAKIVLYCSSGHMSGIAAKKMVELGYTNVWDLAGGMSAWRTAGFSVEGVQ